MFSFLKRAFSSTSFSEIPLLKTLRTAPHISHIFNCREYFRKAAHVGLPVAKQLSNLDSFILSMYSVTNVYFIKRRKFNFINIDSCSWWSLNNEESVFLIQNRKMLPPASQVAWENVLKNNHYALSAESVSQRLLEKLIELTGIQFSMIYLKNFVCSPSNKNVIFDLWSEHIKREQYINRYHYWIVRAVLNGYFICPLYAE